MKCAKYAVTLRISCLLIILIAAEENLKEENIEKNGNSFMIGCFTVGHEEFLLREDLEKPCNFA